MMFGVILCLVKKSLNFKMLSTLLLNLKYRANEPLYKYRQSPTVDCTVSIDFDITPCLVTLEQAMRFWD